MLFNFKMPALFVYYFGMACFGYEGVLVLLRYKLFFFGILPFRLNLTSDYSVLLITSLSFLVLHFIFFVRKLKKRE